jgi:protein neuralized
MASSLAAMPRDSAPWRDPSSRPRPFFNVLIPPHHRHPFSTSDDAHTASSAPVEPTPRRRRIILERWAAAAAAATASASPPPRRAREAELSELASATRPVAARAAVFREPSPAPSDASSTACAAAPGPDLPPSGPRASSLIQRWREIEAVGPVLTPRAASSSAGDAASESDTSPRGRVGCIVKKLSGAASLPEEDLDEAANNEEDLSLSQSAPPSPAPLRNAIDSLAVRVKGHHPPKLVVRTVRGRRAMEELVARMAHRRSCELAALAERHVVSRFGHKGRIQVNTTKISFFLFHPSLLAQCITPMSIMYYQWVASF